MSDLDLRSALETAIDHLEKSDNLGDEMMADRLREALANDMLNPAVFTDEEVLDRLAALQREANLRGLVSGADRETNELMRVAYEQGREDGKHGHTYTPEELRERFPGWTEDVA